MSGTFHMTMLINKGMETLHLCAKKEKEKISKQKKGEADQRKEANYHGHFTRLKSGQFTRPLTHEADGHIRFFCLLNETGCFKKSFVFPVRNMLVWDSS